MEENTKIQSIPELALQYGTINSEQFQQVTQLYNRKKETDSTADWGELLLSMRFATNYQVGLLKLIQEYLILKKRGEEFGKIAVEKGFATQDDVDNALELQKKEFKRAKIKKLIGDILVESRVITVKQKNAILKEQSYLDQQADKIFDSEPDDVPVPQIKVQMDTTKEVSLSSYDKQFLKVKGLDHEFAATVIEKGIATQREVSVAQKVQDDAFEQQNRIRLLGDIMVELNHINEDQKNSILQSQGRLGDEEKLQLNTGIEVTISPDQMEAIIHLKSIKQAVDITHIKKALNQKGVRYGIYPDPILQYHLDEDHDQFVAAHQDYTTERIKDKKAEYHFNTNGIDSEQKEMGETLAVQDLGAGAYVKKDVFGNNIEQNKGGEFTFRCGPGTRLSKDKTKAFAGKTGFPSLSIDRKLYIHPPINVLEDADLKYGALERYANLKILGVLTGAYPVTAGHVDAREIRGANIKSVGDVVSRIGVTESTVNTQGSFKARYVHHSTIFAFGDVMVENEIIDSQIFCSGKIISPHCRVIASDIYGKKGIELAGVGNERTRPCILAAGTEHHIFEVAKTIEADIQTVRQQLDELIDQKNEQESFESKTFQKMVELKIFHDRAKKKKDMLTIEFNKKKKKYKKEKLKNIATLLNNFQNRMSSSISSLKELNKLKKRYSSKKNSIENKIEKLQPKIEKEISELKFDLFSFFEWARKEKNISQIKINDAVFPGTFFKGIFSTLQTDAPQKNILVFEKEISKNYFEMHEQKN